MGLWSSSNCAGVGWKAASLCLGAAEPQIRIVEGHQQFVNENRWQILGRTPPGKAAGDLLWIHTDIVEADWKCNLFVCGKGSVLERER